LDFKKPFSFLEGKTEDMKREKEIERVGKGIQNFLAADQASTVDLLLI